MSLKDYKDFVGTAATLATIIQIFSPSFLCYDIIKKKSTGNVEVTPFVGGMSISVLMLQHGLLLNDLTMIRANFFGLLLNAIYFLIYYKYSDSKTEILMKCAKSAACVAVLIAYANLGDTERVEFIFGIIITLLLLTLMASPLFSLKEIITKKDTSCLPFPLILSGAFVTFFWLLYGIIIENIFIQFQNMIGFLLCMSQLSLFIIIPRTSHRETKKRN